MNPALADNRPPTDALDIGALAAACRQALPDDVPRKLDVWVTLWTTQGESTAVIENALLHYVSDAAAGGLADAVLIEAIVEKFGWDRYEHRFQSTALEGPLPELILAARARAEAGRLSATGAGAEQRLVFESLRNPPRPLWFHLLSASPAHRRAAAALLQRFEDKFPAMRTQELDAKSLQWWQNHVTGHALTLPRFAVAITGYILLTVFCVFVVAASSTRVPPWAALVAGALIGAGGCAGGWAAVRRLATWRQYASLDHGVRIASVLVFAAAPLVRDALTASVGVTIFLVLAASRIGGRNACLSGLIAVPSALLLQAWMTKNGVAGYDRPLMIYAISYIACALIMIAAARLSLASHGGVKRLAVPCSGFILLYGPLLLLRHLH